MQSITNTIKEIMSDLLPQSIFLIFMYIGNKMDYATFGIAMLLITKVSNPSRIFSEATRDIEQLDR